MCCINIFWSQLCSMFYQLMVLLIYTPKGCFCHEMENNWFALGLVMVYEKKLHLLFNNKKYFWKIIWHKSTATWNNYCLCCYFWKTMTWHDIHQNFRNAKPRKIIEFRFQTFFCKDITYVVVNPGNQYKWNYQWINKL